MDAIFYLINANSRATRVAQFVTQGFRKLEYSFIVADPNEYSEFNPAPNLAVFYGFEQKTPEIMENYKRQGKNVLFIDLGYWARRYNGRWDGFHKITLNSRHPNDYFEKFKKIPIRSHAAPWIPKVKPWKKNGRHIIVAGMSEKAARNVGLKPEQWERETINKLRKLTDREIYYRPKPSWPGAKPIQGTKYDRGPLAQSLKNCHAVVSRHSNVSVDAILEGIPSFCIDGAAKPMSCQNLNCIEQPLYPEERELWRNSISWCQFDASEMVSGDFIKFFDRMGLIN